MVSLVSEDPIRNIIIIIIMYIYRALINALNAQESAKRDQEVTAKRDQGVTAKRDQEVTAKRDQEVTAKRDQGVTAKRGQEELLMQTCLKMSQ